MEKALERDEFTCRFCGFQARQYQRVVPYENAGQPPFATACTFCEQCLSLERTGMMGAGVLVWLPEIPQADLHHIMRAVYVARASSVAELSAAATRTFDALMARRAEARKRIGSDDPLLLATIMFEALDDAEYDKSAAKLDGIRLLPLDKYVVHARTGNVNQFPQLVKYWRSPQGPYGKLPVEQWSDLFKTTQAAAGNA